MMDNLVTVIVPVYNSDKTIEKTIESIINQTYKNIEILLIDDGSIDNSIKICEKYASEDKRIKLIKKEKNSGVSDTRNIGISAAKGEYITFVDADDIIVNDFIEYSVNVSKKQEADIIIGSFKKLCNDKATNITFNEDKSISKEEIIEYEKAILSNKDLGFPVELLGFSTGKIYKNKIIKQIKFNTKIRFREDSLFNLEAYSLSSRIYATNKIVYIYIINNNSASFRFLDNYEDEVKEFFKSIEKLKNAKKMEKEINICGLYMYMNYLKHYAMHVKAQEKNLISHNIIKESTNTEFWHNFFQNVDSKQISLPYKFLRLLFLKKCTYGIMILYKINNIRGEKI